ncbi:phospholipid/cholesterol/gamma-HCH transport system substrate-binding protein [Mumia flava]|uniref:Phospholipid/cholesterol/gamma-HCH transport system substrate-binding protein n=1 Tax=Mumia flava TaxID=1348852 RepID=A0A0B2BN83_9ACTN|nr:MlaD family protein [Mumia flava]PJJ58299.1 phospholipid/cholesterol/gamma-HCH transport system substrate-binding protein [Mumia flava]
MITSKVKIQLIAFLALTLLGLAYVGTQYAKIDRLWGADGYSVVVEMADSGGIFTGADVTYRGVSVGQVSDMWLTVDGVDVEVRIEDEEVDIPADTDVVVANKSAVGEQYLDFQPATDSEPYLVEGTTLPRERTQVPIDTRTLLTDVSALLESVDADDLSTVVTELGTAFKGSSDDLRTIIDSSSSFITTAEEKYEVTAALIRESNTVLKTQVESQSEIRTFATNLSRLTSAVRSSDADLRTVLDTGPATAAELRTFLSENSAGVARLLGTAIDLNEVVVAELDGVQAVLAIAPYGVESAYSIIATDSRTGLASVRLSLSLQPANEPCFAGYAPDPRRRTPYNRTPSQWNPAYTCKEKQPRGTGKAGSGSRTAPASTTATPDEPVTLGTYDVATKQLVLDEHSTIPAGADLGKESWKWMVMGPAVAR